MIKRIFFFIFLIVFLSQCSSQRRTIDADAYTEFFKLMLDEYEKRYIEFKGDFTDKNFWKQNQIEMLRIIKDLVKLIRTRDPSFAPFYYQLGRWYMMVHDLENGEVAAHKGLKLLKKNRHSYDFEIYKFYNMQGRIHFMQESRGKAMKKFLLTLETRPSDPVANYYMGRMALTDLGDLDKAYEYFSRAKYNWKNSQNKEYIYLLYGLVYTSYFKSVRMDPEENTILADKLMKDVLNDLNELLLLTDGHYIIRYMLSAAYLHLEEFDFAISEISLLKKKLSNFLDHFEYYSGNVTPDLQHKVKVITDLYNNLAVAYIGKALNNERPVYYKKKALKNLIDSIDMKEKIGLSKGTPNLNFNQLNRKDPGTFRQYLIADDFFPLDIELF